MYQHFDYFFKTSSISSALNITQPCLNHDQGASKLAFPLKYDVLPILETNPPTSCKKWLLYFNNVTDFPPVSSLISLNNKIIKKEEINGFSIDSAKCSCVLELRLIISHIAPYAPSDFNVDFTKFKNDNEVVHFNEKKSPTRVGCCEKALITRKRVTFAELNLSQATVKEDAQGGFYLFAETTKPNCHCSYYFGTSEDLEADETCEF
jgi:hypothetical protein